MYYSQNFYSKEEDFWAYSHSQNDADVKEHEKEQQDLTKQDLDLTNVRINRTAYRALRRKYGAEHFEEGGSNRESQPPPPLVDLYTKVGDCSRAVEESRSGPIYHLWRFITRLT